MKFTALFLLATIPMGILFSIITIPHSKAGLYRMTYTDTVTACFLIFTMIFMYAYFIYIVEHPSNGKKKTKVRIDDDGIVEL